MTIHRTRFAPSPTGALHIGNIFAFLVNWALAKQQHWTILMRIEDIDGPRKKTGSIGQTLETFEWLGLKWAEDVRVQSHDLTAYRTMISSLIKDNHVYHCSLSRKEREEALSAPHQYTENIEHIQRPLDIAKHNNQCPDQPTNWRFLTTGQSHTLHDEISGDIHYYEIDDFIVWTKKNLPSYQLAVVSDDHDQGITHVVRGNDLLQSAAWQEELYAAMGWPHPLWYHLPLIVGPDGKRLAKRHGDSRISSYRNQKVTPEHIIGLIAMWTNIQTERSLMALDEFAEQFDIRRLQNIPIVFTKEDEAWLLG